MSHQEIRQKFLDFFKKRGHTIVPSSSLLPDDPSVLFTTAGMQQFKPYYTGELDPDTVIHPNLGKPIGRRAVSIQKSLRTSDIDEVGDKSHLTFFEMLGNFAFGTERGYFKKEAIRYAYDFLIQELGLELDYVTVFDPTKVAKDDWRASVPFDQDSYNILKDEIRIPEEKIRRAGIDNFWGPTGNEGPCGPTVEFYVDNIEVWNLVFNEFYCDKEKTLTPLNYAGVDTGMGLERLAMVVQKKKNIFETDLLESIVKLIPHDLDVRTKRIITDHSRAVVFLLADGVRPSNKEQGYILRRLVRRIVLYEHLNSNLFLQTGSILGRVIDMYFALYEELNNVTLISEFNKERVRFNKSLRQGLKKFNDFVLRRELKRGRIGVAHDQEILYGEDAFYLYQSFGFPREVMRDLCKVNNIFFDEEGFNEEFKKHQEKSRAGAEKKFGGHGLILNTGELKAADEAELQKVTRLHTATHLLHSALRKVLGESVHQAGSDITAERTRFDFTFDRKLTDEEKKKIEDMVNDVIKNDLPVNKVVMPQSEAEKTGALFYFKEKYPDPVNVYFVGKTLDTAFSKEFCGGPHVTHTGEIGTFKIVKEEAVSAGVRRIRATVE